MAMAIGAGLPVEESFGTMVVDIGGGTTEMAVISLGGIVINKSIRVAGDEMDEAIINHIRLKYGVLLGERTAEDVKIAIGSALPEENKDKETPERHAVVRGRDLETGLPRSFKVSETEIREALSPVVSQIVDNVADLIEETPPELVADILERGITMGGGGSQLRGLDRLVAERTKMPVWVSDDPMTCVVRGCGKLLDEIELLNKVRVTGGLR
jgi:rod shape-determining protein MreB